MNSNNKGKSSSHRTYGKQKFDDRYRRMTIYIEQDLFDQIQYKREQGVITNLTKFINQAVTNYLDGG